MTEPKVYYRKPFGLRVQAFGDDDDLPDGNTHAALDGFFETLNAAMGPLLNAPAITMLYAPGAMLEIEMPGNDCLPLHKRCRGESEIESFFEELTRSLVSIVHIERHRAVNGRKALAFGIVRGLHAGCRLQRDLDFRIALEFDEHDLVTHQTVRIRTR